MKLYTIGFTQKSAQTFFEILKSHQVQCVVDVRSHPDGQLAGFAKKSDLQYFLKTLIDCDYRHMDSLAPVEEDFKVYRNDKDWQKYKTAYLALMEQRGIPQNLDRALFEEKTCCLLCSEASAETCHRRLAAELIATAWPNVTVIHL